MAAFSKNVPLYNSLTTKKVVDITGDVRKNVNVCGSFIICPWAKHAMKFDISAREGTEYWQGIKSNSSRQYIPYL